MREEEKRREEKRETSREFISKREKAKQHPYPAVCIFGIASFRITIIKKSNVFQSTKNEKYDAFVNVFNYSEHL